MPKGTPLDESRYDRLLELIDQSGEGRLHCTEAAQILGCHARNVSARLSFALERGLVHRVTEGRATYYLRGPSPDARAEDEIGEFMPSLWADGELMLRGLPDPREDGSIVLTSAQRRRLRNLLTGQL
jgi:hypothetical protein